MLASFSIRTQKEGMYNITSQVKETLAQSGISDGICVIFCPHTTAGITINENCDPDVEYDVLLGLRRAFPDRSEFLHDEGNSHAHLKSSCVGCNQSVIIEQGRMLLGVWQGIYFCEFDGPRTRTFYVKVIGNTI